MTGRSSLYSDLLRVFESECRLTVDYSDDKSTNKAMAFEELIRFLERHGCLDGMRPVEQESFLDALEPPAGRLITWTDFRIILDLAAGQRFPTKSPEEAIFALIRGILKKERRSEGRTAKRSPEGDKPRTAIPQPLPLQAVTRSPISPAENTPHVVIPQPSFPPSARTDGQSAISTQHPVELRPSTLTEPKLPFHPQASVHTVTEDTTPGAMVDGTTHSNENTTQTATEGLSRKHPAIFLPSDIEKVYVALMQSLRVHGVKDTRNALGIPQHCTFFRHPDSEEESLLPYPSDPQSFWVDAMPVLGKELFPHSACRVTMQELAYQTLLNKLDLIEEMARA